MKINIKLITLLLISLYVNGVFSQTFKKYYGGKNTEYGTSIALSANGSLVVAGSSNSSGNKQIFLLKVDASGKEIWSNNFGGKSYEEGTSVKCTKDGGYVVCGITKSFKNNYEGDMYLIKTDSLGKEQWSKFYGGEKMEIANSVLQYSDEGYVLVGSAKSEDRSQDIYVVKTDEKGNEQWNKTFSAKGTYDAEGTGVCLGKNEGIIVGGAIQNEKGFNNVLIKIGAGKDSSWQKNSGGQESNHIRSVKSCTDQGIVCCGIIGGGKGNAFIMKNDAKGNKIWVKNIGFPASSEVFNDVIESSDKCYVAVGSNDAQGGNGKYDVYVVKFDAKGKVIWEKFLGTPADDYGNAIVETKNGGFAITGTSNYDANSSEQILIYKINSKGEVEP